MSMTDEEDLDMDEARIVALLNDHNEPLESGPVFRLVINTGSDDGVSNGDRYLIYSLGPVMTDPINGESLGQLEIVRGSARVIHVQERVSIVRTEETKEESQVVGRSALLAQLATERVSVAVPFRSPKVGDFARPV
jgi:hypothetical protein